MRRWLPRNVRLAIDRFIPDGDLTKRTIQSGAWEFAINIGTRSLQLIVLIILANLLSPRDFGLMGIALLVLAALERFSRLGINQALIQHEDDDVDRYLDTAFGLGIGRALLLSALAFAGAPLVADVFSEPRVAPLLQFLAVSPLLLGLRNTGTVYFEKDLQFHLKFVYRISGSLVEFVVSIVWAYVYRDVWALAVGYVAADAVRIVVSYLIHDYRPRPALDVDMARELLDYGKWITANNVVAFLLEEGDDAVIGGVIGATALGFYKYAYRIGNAPATEVTKVIGDVMFSSFSKLQNDDGAMRTAFVRTIRVVAAGSVPTSIGIVVVAPVFVRGFLGNEWLPMVRVMQILSLYGLLLSMTTVFHQLWKAIGRPDLVTKLEVIRLVLLGALVLPATRFGIEGVAALVAGVYLATTVPANLYLLRRLTDISRARLGLELAYPLLAGLFMGVVVLFARSALSLPPIVEFAALVAVGVGTYLPAVLAIDSTVEWGLRRNLTTILHSLRS